MHPTTLTVVGGGPGGYVAAIRAAQLGLSVTLVEKENLGGVCLNWGCIPTKALLTCAEAYENLASLEKLGIKVENASFDLGAMVDHSRQTSEKLCGGIAFLMKKSGIKVIKGHARLSGKKGEKHLVGVEGNTPQTLETDHVILATGARPVVLPGMEVDGKHIWTSKEAMLQRTLPKSLLVLGSGAIGLEFASFYKSLGTDVTVVELQDRLLPVADPFLSDELHKAFQKRGITCRLGCKALNAKVERGTLQLSLEGGEALSADALLLAVGVRGNTENLGLKEAGVTLHKGRIQVNAYGETSAPGVYAIGDVTDEPWLAHKASHEGIVAAEHLAGHGPHTLSKQAIPSCVYSAPQIASIGLTEPEATAAGYDLAVGHFPFSANGKALAMGLKDGAIKTIFDKKTGAFLGAHMIGAHVTELVATFSLAKIMEATDEELAHTVFPHPTLSEMLHESVLSAIGRGIHA